MSKSKGMTAFQNIAMTTDERSFGVYKMLMDVYPAFADKIFHKNDIMLGLAMSGANPMDILDYPVCGSCETIASPAERVFHKGKHYPSCICFADGCGKTTIDPVTLREWMIDELKQKLKDKSPEILEAIEYTVDHITRMMTIKYVDNAIEQLQKEGKDTRIDTTQEEIAATYEAHRSKPEEVKIDVDIEEFLKEDKEGE